MLDGAIKVNTKYTTGKRIILMIVLPYVVKKAEAKNSKIRSFKAFPYGLLSLATYLKVQGKDKVEIKIIDCNNKDEESYLDDIKQRLLECKPDIVGLSMMFDNSYRYVGDITNIIKKHNRDTIIVLGGVATTSSYRAIIEEQENIDGICFSEGELPFLRLINSENMLKFLENDQSWVTKKSIQAGKTPEKSLLENLDEVINIDYSLIDISEYSTMQESFSPFAGDIENPRQFFVVTSRGCPFKCTFCMRSSDDDKTMRYASVKKIIEHIEFLVSNYGMNILTFYDDQILLNKKRAKQLFRELAKFNLRIECPNGLTVAFIDEEMAELMKKAGMHTVYLAIESGSPHVLNNIIKKPLRLEMVRPVVQSLRKFGFWIQGYFVSGMPGERDEHREETIRFIKDVELDWAGFSLATPSWGSELYRMCVKKGYIKNLRIGELDADKYIINTPEYTAEYVARKTYLMNLDVNFVNNYRMKIGDYQVAASSFRDVIKRYIDHAFAYYYLARAQEAMNEDPELIKLNKDKFNEIIKRDNVWKEYAEYFNLNPV